MAPLQVSDKAPVVAVILRLGHGNAWEGVQPLATLRPFPALTPSTLRLQVFFPLSLLNLPRLETVTLLMAVAEHNEKNNRTNNDIFGTHCSFCRLSNLRCLFVGHLCCPLQLGEYKRGGKFIMEDQLPIRGGVDTAGQFLGKGPTRHFKGNRYAHSASCLIHCPFLLVWVKATATAAL